MAQVLGLGISAFYEAFVPDVTGKSLEDEEGEPADERDASSTASASEPALPASQARSDEPAVH